MKKLLAILLCVLALATLVSCGEKPAEPSSPSEPSATTPSEPSTPAEPAPTPATVTFNPDNTFSPTKVETTVGATLEAPEQPKRNGFTFDAWYAGDTKVTFPVTVTGDAEYTARWIPLPTEPTTITEQPKAVTVPEGTLSGPSVKATEPKSHVLSYQWYINTTNSKTGATAIPGATDATCTLPATLKNGDKAYVYCVVTCTRKLTKIGVDAESELAEVNVTKGTQAILLIGSGLFYRTSDSGPVDNRCPAGQDIDVTDFLKALIKASGKEVEVDMINCGNSYNIWESDLTGKDQSTVRKALAAKSYSAIFLQMGRDYVLVTPSTREKELDALNNIAKIAAELNPNAKVIMEMPPWRNDMKVSYWPRFKTEGGFSTPEEHKVKIREYITNYCTQAAPDALISDVSAGFEKCIADGIQPFFAADNDFPSQEGSYLTACMFYASAFGESPVGLNAFAGEKFSVDPAVGAKLQQIAADIVLAQ